MHYETKNTGTLWLEVPKTDRSPNWTGTLEDENGKKWRIVGWNRTTKTGKDLISLKIEELQELQERKETGAWEEQRQKFEARKDVVLTDIDEGMSDEDILKSIPF